MCRVFFSSFYYVHVIYKTLLFSSSVNFYNEWEMYMLSVKTYLIDFIIKTIIHEENIYIISCVSDIFVRSKWLLLQSHILFTCT